MAQWLSTPGVKKEKEREKRQNKKKKMEATFPKIIPLW